MLQKKKEKEISNRDSHSTISKCSDNTIAASGILCLASTAAGKCRGGYQQFQAPET